MMMAAARIRSRVPSVDGVARFGGDEFVAPQHNGIAS